MDNLKIGEDSVNQCIMTQKQVFSVIWISFEEMAIELWQYYQKFYHHERKWNNSNKGQI